MTTTNTKYTYTINLIWINKTVDNKNNLVCPSSSWANIIKWAHLNPNAHINLWYLPAFCSQIQIQRTMSAIENETELKNLRARDLDEITSNDFYYISQRQSEEASAHHSFLKCQFNDPIISVYWKADLARYLVLTELAKKHPPDWYHCYSDLDLAQYNVECAFNNHTQYIHRLKLFGVLFCHSDRTSLGIENGFIILAGSAFSLIDAMKFLMLDVATILMNYFLKLSNSNGKKLAMYTKMYSLDQWGYTHLSQLFSLDQLIRELYYLKSPKIPSISLKGSSLGITSDEMALEYYIDLILRYPVLTLENLVFWYWPNQFSLSNYVEYISIRRSRILTDNTITTNQAEKDSACHFATDCSNSTFELDEAEAKRINDLSHRGIGHDPKVLNSIRLIKVKDWQFFSLKRTTQFKS